jgi:hypothetical protein
MGQDLDDQPISTVRETAERFWPSSDGRPSLEVAFWPRESDAPSIDRASLPTVADAMSVYAGPDPNPKPGGQILGGDWVSKLPSTELPDYLWVLQPSGQFLYRHVFWEDGPMSMIPRGISLVHLAGDSLIVAGNLTKVARHLG